jgi:hypothetical protein
MFALVPSRLDPTPIAATLLIAATFAAWRGDAAAFVRKTRIGRSPTIVERRLKIPHEHRPRLQFLLGTSGALACILAVGISVVSARTYFEPVTALSLVNGVNQAPVAEVTLASPPAPAKLELVDGGEILSTYQLRRVNTQRVTLPASAAVNKDQVVLVIAGHVVREVTV